MFPNTAIDRANIKGTWIPRYIHQRDKRSCGPVAIINYWKFMGLKADYSDLRFLKKILGTNKDGTTLTVMAAFLNRKWKKVDKIRCPAIVNDDTHFWFCPYSCTGGYITINYGIGTYHFISNRRMKSILKTSEVLLL